MEFFKSIKLSHYLNLVKLGKFDSYLKLTPKHILFFFFIYSILLLIFNLVFVLTTQVSSERIEFLVRFPLSFSFSLMPCTIAKTGSFNLYGNITCATDFGVILLYTYLAVISFLLVFIGKLKFGYWIIGFIFFNLLVNYFLLLKDYLYLYN